MSSYLGMREVGHGGDVQGFASVLYAIGEEVRCGRPKQWREGERFDRVYRLGAKIYEVVTAH